MTGILMMSQQDEEHNKRFASCDHLPDVHRSVEGLDLTNIFAFQTERRLRNDYTIMLDGRYIQLQSYALSQDRNLDNTRNRHQHIPGESKTFC